MGGQQWGCVGGFVCVTWLCAELTVVVQTKSVLGTNEVSGKEVDGLAFTGCSEVVSYVAGIRSDCIALNAGVWLLKASLG